MKPIYINKLAIVAIILAVIGLAFKPYWPDFDRIVQHLNYYSQSSPDEKVYLHFDKPIYKPGDIIWFSAYNVIGEKHQPVRGRKIITVELFDPKGSKIMNFNGASNDGRMSGDFHIDKTMPGGIYTIKAYTENLKSLGEEFYFSRKITIQKYIKPQLLLKLEFEKEAYGPGEHVNATIKIRNLEDEPLVLYPFTYQVSLSGKQIMDKTAETSADGETRLSFVLPDTLKNSDGLLNILVTYDKKVESISRSIPVVLNNISLDFFPEGGKLIEGVKTQIAFKALNEFGKPADISGKVYDQDDRLITKFSSFHDGMGAFEIEPLKGKTYYAKITEPIELGKQYTIPIAQKTGYSVYNVKSLNSALDFTFHAPKNERLKIIVQMGDEIFFEKNESLKETFKTISISTDSMPRGIARITLFDSELKPQSERLVFVNYDLGLQIKITPDREKYAPRDKVTLNVETYDKSGKPISANLSLAAVSDKVVSLADDKQDNILSWFLLSAGVKGKIHEPNFYFNYEEEKAEKAMDYLLMTQAWRCFGWREVLNSKEKITHNINEVEVIKGKVADRITGEGIPATIQAIERGEQSKAIEFQTNNKGEFIILGTDPLTSVTLCAQVRTNKRKNAHIVIDSIIQKRINTVININNENEGNVYEIIKEIVEDLKVDKNTEELNSETSVDNIGGINFSLTEDISELSEIVVIGYGSQKKLELTGAISQVQEQSLSAYTDITSAIQGSIAGVRVLENTNSVQSPADIKIRGLGSINHEQPLFVIDGEVYDPATAGTINSLDILDGNNIERIEVLKSTASSVYGCRAANGVILITTKNRHNNGYSCNMWNRDIYHYIGPRVSRSWGRHFYSPNYSSRYYPKSRTDFRETVYWAPQIRTDSYGKATISYHNSDEISTFRITVEGFSNSGNIGRCEETYYTQKPLSMEVKLPEFIMVGDTINVNVIVKNNSWWKISGNVACSLGAGLRLAKAYDSYISIDPDQALLVPIQILGTNECISSKISLEFKNDILKDRVQKRIEVYKTGFPIEISVSGKEINKQSEFYINKPLNGTLSASFKAYPSIINNLLDGIEAIIREPYGCFEQTSSATYPNIMILQYLRTSEKSNDNIEKKALGFIEKGYRRLVGFEINEGGFDWYGRAPGHLGLTAYGLVEFTDMKKVFPFVNDRMIERTKKWILNKRDGLGNFIQPRFGYSFRGGSQAIINAYVLFALSEAGLNYNECKIEMDLAMNEVIQSVDSYRLGLLANAAFNFGLTEEADQLTGMIHNQLKKSSPGKFNTKSTVTYSSGKSAQVETASLLLLALLKETGANSLNIELLTRYIAESRSSGGFGSTQATVLALKALVEAYSKDDGMGNRGIIELVMNNQIIAKRSYEIGSSEAIRINDLTKYLTQGSNTVQVRIDNEEAIIPYTLDIAWKSITPQSDKNCTLDINTKLARKIVKEAETVRLQVQIINTSNDDVPMPMAIIGMPAGLSPQMWQLKKLQDEGTFSYYELRNHHLVLYFKGMSASEQKVINFDLNAEISGYYQAPASYAYLYYNSENKKWIDGESIWIE